MVHLRLNETESNPNPHINFITALPDDAESEEQARQLLRALAAQVRPVMKDHGLAVNSFEEYEYNAVFAGRNWNNGETVELVLRRPDGSFYPISWLMSTLCHELAHNKHMNHGPAFQSLWTRFRTEVRRLQDRGYYGDGYWSSGTRLKDSVRVGGEGIEDGDLPEYVCGGAQSRKRPTATRRRRRVQGKRREVQPSLHTGAQTAKKRKAGSRVTSKYAFTGQGASLSNEGKDGKGAGFGKQAASQRARQERALAAERRMLALQGGKETKPSVSTSKEEEHDSDEDDGDDVEFVEETDEQRRQALLDSESHEDNKQRSQHTTSKDSWKLLRDESSSFPAAGPSTTKKKATTSKASQVLDLCSSSESESEREPPNCDAQTISTRGSTATTQQPSASFSKAASQRPRPGKTPLVLGKIMHSEIELRKKEAIGLAPVKEGGRTLGAAPSSSKGAGSSAKKLSEAGGRSLATVGNQGSWSCRVCTLENEADHLSCSACTTPRGQDIWPQQPL